MKFHLSTLFACMPYLTNAKLGSAFHGERQLQSDLPLKDVYPLGQCAGDCDNDDDCRWNFICFQRGPNESVPGCSGGSSDGSRTDYCVNARDVPVRPLQITQSFPLGHCEGDCDDDDDCEFDYVCYQRDPNESVPGCSGGSSDGSRTDYCVRPNEVLTPLRITRSFPLGNCEGDCDSDNDCERYLTCYQRDENESVPGCSGGSSDGSRTDYCIGRAPFPITQAYPLGRCEGDCDSNEDCGSGLVCHQRDGFESVPGCSGGSSLGENYDYCIRASDVPVRPLMISQSFPLGHCEGDCDNNDDCDSGLVCYQRDENESVPGCSGGSSDGSRTDYCIYE